MSMGLQLKEIQKEYIQYLRSEIPRLMSRIERYLPPTFFNAQEHHLIHKSEIEMFGIIHTM